MHFDAFVWAVWMGWCLGHWTCVPYVKVPWNTKEDHTDVEAFYQPGVSVASVQRLPSVLLQSGRFPRTVTMSTFCRLVYPSLFPGSLIPVSSASAQFNCVLSCIDSNCTLNREVVGSNSIIICLLFGKWILNKVRSPGYFIASGSKDRATRKVSVCWHQHLQQSLKSQTKIETVGSFQDVNSSHMADFPSRKWVQLCHDPSNAFLMFNLENLVLLFCSCLKWSGP